MKKIVNIDTNTRRFFRQYLNIIKPLLVPRLSNGELNVLAELLFLNDKYKSIDVKERGKLIFDYDNKMEMVDNLSTTFSTFRNTLTSLRKKGYIVNNSIRKDLLIEPGNQMLLGFNFSIKDELDTE